jgi:hypothetical protein
VQQEVLLGQVLTPPPGMRSRTLHAVGAVPKPEAGSVRAVHDVSPDGALNGLIFCYRRRFTTISDIASTITQNCFAAKADIRFYFLNFPVNPLHWSLQGFLFPLFDEGLTELWCLRLMFGLRHAPEIAHRYTQAVVRLMQREGWPCSYGLLDDFWVQHDTEAGCWLGLCFLVVVMTHLGFALHFGEGKFVTPRRRLVMLGVEVDTAAMQLRLDPARVQRVRAQVRDVLWRAQHHVAANAAASAGGGQRRSFCLQRRDLESLLGRLGWCAHVVECGRAYLNALRRCVRGVRSPGHHVTVSSVALAELRWWESALGDPRFNGTRALVGQPGPLRYFQTDARGIFDSSFPCVGIFVEGGFAALPAQRLRALAGQLEVEPPPDDAPIAVWELFAVLAAALLFSSHLSGGRWCVLVDNSSPAA